MITKLKSGRLRLVARLVVVALLGGLATVVPLSIGVADAAPLPQGYWFVAADGGIFNYGGASFFGSAGGTAHPKPVVGMAATRSGNGYWIVTADGSVFNYGDAPALSPATSINPAKPIVGMAATPSGNGYWLVASDGGIFSYGDATFHGSTGAIALNQPIVGMAAAPNGQGYWLVAADGGIFAFDAAFFGSTGAIRLNRPIVGMTASPSGQGYWFVASDGGIFAFGDAAFFGSTGAITLNQPVVGMSATPTGQGYWLVARDGGIFSFGDAEFKGSTGAITLNQPIVGMATGSSNDSSAPVISNVAAAPSAFGATITWTTNEFSDSQVQYGLTAAYGSATTLNASPTTSHAQTLSGLNASTPYHFRVLSRDASGNLATSGDQTFTTTALSTVQLSSLQPTYATNSWGPWETNMSNGELAARDGGPLTIGGTAYANGLGVNADSELRYALPGDCTTFSANVGIDDEITSIGRVTFRLFSGTTQLGAAVGPVSFSDGPVDFTRTITGVTDLRLVVDSVDGTVSDHADWADAKVTCATTPGQPAAIAFGGASTLATGTHPHSIASGLIDAGSTLDMVVVNSSDNNVSILLGNGSGGFSQTHVATDTEPKSAVLADVNHDNKLDIVTANQTPSSVSVLIGNGDGTFQSHVDFAAASESHEAAVADVNHDTHPDIVVTGWGSSNVDVLLGNGSGGFATAVAYTVGLSPLTVQIADFNNDGDPDLVVGNGDATENTVSVLLGNGDGTFAGAAFIVTGGSVHSVRVADLNADGNLDVVTANQFADTVSVLYGIGDGTFQPHIDLAVATTPKSLVLTDIDGDGRIDIVVATINGNYPTQVNPGGDKVTILKGTANGFPTRQDVSVGSGPFGIAIGDLNGDGHKDIVTGNWWDGNITIRLAV